MKYPLYHHVPFPSAYHQWSSLGILWQYIMADVCPFATSPIWLYETLTQRVHRHPEELHCDFKSNASDNSNLWTLNRHSEF